MDTRTELAIAVGEAIAPVSRGLLPRLDGAALTPEQEKLIRQALGEAWALGWRRGMDEALTPSRS